MLKRDGEVWRHLPHDAAGFSQKTFWWSLGYSSAKEPEPAIVVTGKRLDAVGSFNAGDPGTNATADFGTSMLVGVEVPSAGCWSITASYRSAKLTFVAWIEGE